METGVRNTGGHCAESLGVMTRSYTSSSCLKYGYIARTVWIYFRLINMRKLLKWPEIYKGSIINISQGLLCLTMGSLKAEYEANIEHRCFTWDVIHRLRPKAGGGR